MRADVEREGNGEVVKMGRCATVVEFLNYGSLAVRTGIDNMRRSVQRQCLLHCGVAA